MGLCKCPKKKVTSLFCFEHRVNVCEHCLVTNHTRCIVQSYLQWLQDSDYDPQCKLCNQSLAASGPCVRLMCYDVFHWSCLDEFARSLPPTTAPAGYCCPTCRSGVFPGSNVASPVADSLRQRLAEVNWARAGLGLSLMPATEEKVPERRLSTTVNIDNCTPHTHLGTTYARPDKDSVLVSRDLPHDQKLTLHVAPTTPSSLSGPAGSAPPPANDLEDDHDHNKYKRRPAMQWLSRWFRSRMMPGKTVTPPVNRTRRCAVLSLLFALAAVSLITLMYRFGRGGDDFDDDPFKQLPDNVAVEN